jgi:hypothetical protein
MLRAATAIDRKGASSWRPTTPTVSTVTIITANRISARLRVDVETDASASASGC